MMLATSREDAMKRTLILFCLVVLCLGLYAQWSTNPSFPNQINPLTDTQVMPKTVITSGGITWIAWMDNLTGNYNTYLQKLSIIGQAEWTNPLLVSSYPTMTWLTEWDIDCDAEGNVVLTFQDIRLGTNNVVAYKISHTGTFLWGLSGVMLSNDTDIDIGNMSPTLACMPDGNTVVAWQRINTSTSIIMQSISPTGTLLWGQSGITLVPATGSYTWPQLLPSDDCCFLLKYYEDTGPFWAPTRKLVVQKFNASGQPLWTTPTYVQNLGGITAWTQWLSITDDGLGGMVICWHDDRNSENITYSYVQRILLNGTVTMPANGALVSTETGYHQFYPKIALDESNQNVYVFWNRVNGNQNMWGLQAQKLALDGVRMWNGTGVAVEPYSNYPTYPIKAFRMEAGIVFLYSISPLPDTDQVENLKVYCINPEGLPVWNAGLGNIAITMTNKLHFDSCQSQGLWGVVTWEDGNTDTKIYAMRFNYNGSLGQTVPMPYNLSAQIQDENNVLLTWEFPEIAVMPIAYKVYRNGVFFHLVQGGGLMQDTIHNLGPGLWSFYVTAVYENNDESPPSNEATINITGTDESENIIVPLAVTLYPNPFRNGTTLRFKNSLPMAQTDISVFNLKGQLIRTAKGGFKTNDEWLWDGKDVNGLDLGTSIFLIKVRQAGSVVTVKAVKY